MAVRKSAAQSAQKWNRRVTGAAQDYKDGVAGASGWQAAATGAAARRNAGLTQAIADGRIDAGINRVGDAGWKAATTAKAGNWGTGVAQAQGRYQQGIQAVLNDLQQAAQQTANIDTSTIDGRLQKMAAHARAMHDLAVARKTGR